MRRDDGGGGGCVGEVCVRVRGRLPFSSVDVKSGGRGKASRGIDLIGAERVGRNMQMPKQQVNSELVDWFGRFAFPSKKCDIDSWNSLSF